MMMVHIGQPDVAETIHNAWLRTLEEGIHTYDVYRRGIETGVSKQEVGTKEFADAVIARLGKLPETLKPVTYAKGDQAVMNLKPYVAAEPAKRDLVGVDVFLYNNDRDPNKLGDSLVAIANGDGLALSMVSNRGQKVYPNGLPETFCVDHWRCRFMSTTDGARISHTQIIALLGRMAEAGFDFIKTENLCVFDGEAGYSLGQGQ